ncbi:flavin monoamine oxidase family protein [Pikeienuella sp. HZG-20]|uniref:flavin monoamine oxidase family protein n=1 Tax=Paludibacillus litoralis TaxID=3133267 RepID=UPI0030EC16F3
MPGEDGPMETEVAIVGGGLSGLALARRLDRSGVDFQLLEARGRFGGRIAALETPSGPVDLGPSWFWPGQPRMAALLAALDLSGFPQYAEGDLSFEDEAGRAHRGVGFASMAGSIRIAGGVVRLVDALVAGLPGSRLHRGARVSALDSAGGVHLADGRAWRARRIVLALPPRVAAKVTFRPALAPEQIGRLERIPTWMAGHAKFVAVYDAPFWRASGLSGDAMSRRGPLVEIHDASGPDGAPAALFGFLGPAPAHRAHRADEIEAAALAQLARIFGAAAGAPTQTALQDWAFEPETATEQDFIPPAAHPDYAAPFARPGLWNGRLQFASTETAPEMGGYMEGALAAAERMAADIIELYK